MKQGTLKMLVAGSLLVSVNMIGCMIIEEDNHDGNWHDWEQCDERDPNCDCDGDGHPDNNGRPDQGRPDQGQPDMNQPDQSGPDMGEPDQAPDMDDCTAEDPTEVCGEDGVTYPTPCAASRAHVRAVHKGACGVVCDADAACPDYQLCSIARGRCEPLECPSVNAPVCGADGVTYANACEAQAHHVAVASAGECAPQCVVDTDCDLGSGCADGKCEVISCPPIAIDDHSQEICGDDGFTWASSCDARAAHINVVHQGCCI